MVAILDFPPHQHARQNPEQHAHDGGVDGGAQIWAARNGCSKPWRKRARFRNRLEVSLLHARSADQKLEFRHIERFEQAEAEKLGVFFDSPVLAEDFVEAEERIGLAE